MTFFKLQDWLIVGEKLSLQHIVFHFWKYCPISPRIAVCLWCLCSLLTLLKSFIIIKLVFLAAAAVVFKKELKSQEAKEGGEASLSCETSGPECKVTWWKGSTVLTQGEKYTMEHRAATHILIIHKLITEDSGEYTCDTGDQKSTATLTVKGNRAHLHLSSVSHLLLSSFFLRFISYSS